MRSRSHDSPLQLRLFEPEAAPPPVPAVAPLSGAKLAGDTPSGATSSGFVPTVVLAREPPPASPEPRRGAMPPERHLHERLNRRVEGRIRRLVLTRNRGQILSVRPLPGDPRGLQVRLDACFTEAPEEAIEAVASWLLGRPKERQTALRQIRAHFEQAHAQADAEGSRRRAVKLRPHGAVYDLAEMCADLVRRYFEPAPEVAITWGAAPSGGRRRVQRPTIRLGSYSYATRTVKIHPALDHASVPHFVVEAVVFHELVHAALPPPATTTSRRCLHSAEFYAWEQRFEHFEPAQAWIQKNLSKLLARRRR